MFRYEIRAPFAVNPGLPPVVSSLGAPGKGKPQPEQLGGEGRGPTQASLPLSWCQPDPALFPGVFIICWLPFFITHILNIHCDCNIPPVLYSAFTWLGYVNSAVNPIIYTTFNIEFRKAFMKILHC